MVEKLYYMHFDKSDNLCPERMKEIELSIQNMKGSVELGSTGADLGSVSGVGAGAATWQFKKKYDAGAVKYIY